MGTRLIIGEEKTLERTIGRFKSIFRGSLNRVCVGGKINMYSNTILGVLAYKHE